MDNTEILKKLKEIQSSLSWSYSHETITGVCISEANEKLLELMWDLGFEGFGPNGYVPKKYQ